jgi:glycosyltransferase involved in cell wall biosynthesis
MHPLDPRGQKIGGIESHVRLMLEHAPSDWNVLFVGVDGQGDCRLGEIRQMTFNGRSFDFLPVLFYPEDRIHEAAKGISQSITMRFMAGLLRHFRSIRQAIGHVPASVELQRFEFALVPFLMRLPTVQVVHGEGRREDKMDSLIKKYWFVHRFNENVALRLASRIVCVNPNILARLKRMNQKLASRAVFMPVPVDTKVFQTRDFSVSDNTLRIVFAGRLDEFKDPPTMFRIFRRVHELLEGAFEFHYVGLSDPHRYIEFSPIETFTVRHGFQRPSKVADLMAHCHMGILTSFFEGMPCYLLELLSVGRPMAAIRLPQYDLVIEEGVSGTMVERADSSDVVVEHMATRIVKLWHAIRENKISPSTVHSKAVPFAVDRQLREHFSRHDLLGRPHSRK